MTELQQLYLRHDKITENWEKIGYWIIERELLEEMVKKLTEKWLGIIRSVFFVKFPTENRPNFWRLSGVCPFEHLGNHNHQLNGEAAEDEWFKCMTIRRLGGSWLHKKRAINVI